jgi:hypothetical protein
MLYTSHKYRAIVRLLRLSALNFRSVHVGFVVDSVALVEGISSYASYAP